MKFDIDLKITKDLTTKILDNIKKINQQEVAVGVPKDAGNKDGVSMAYIASIHELGTEDKNVKVKIPKRSFLRSTVEENRDKYASLLGKAAENSLTDGSIKTHLDKVAQELEKDVERKFVSNDWKALKSREGTPLVNSGDLRSSIRGIVRKAKS